MTTFDYRHAYLLLVEHLRDLHKLAQQDRSPAILQCAAIRAWAVVQGLESDEAEDWASRHVYSEVEPRINSAQGVLGFLGALSAEAAKGYAAMNGPNPVSQEDGS